jgi:hypothetical protein
MTISVTPYDGGNIALDQALALGVGVKTIEEAPAERANGLLQLYTEVDVALNVLSFGGGANRGPSVSGAVLDYAAARAAETLYLGV